MKQMRKRNTKESRSKIPGDAPSGRQTMLPRPVIPRRAAGEIADRDNLRQRKREAIEGESNDLGAEAAGGKPPKGEKASKEKWEQIHRRAEELAMTQGKRPGEAEERHLRRAKRELLGLQTLPDPENPQVRKKS